MLLVALLTMRKSAKLSLTQSEKYTEQGYILEYPPARLAIGTYTIAQGVWLGSGVRAICFCEHHHQFVDKYCNFSREECLWM